MRQRSIIGTLLFLLPFACSTATPAPTPSPATGTPSVTEIAPVKASDEKVFLGMVHATCKMIPTRPPATDVVVPSASACASIPFILDAESGAYHVRKYPDAAGKLDFDVTVGPFYRLRPELKKGWTVERKGNDRLQTGDTVDFILRYDAGAAG